MSNYLEDLVYGSAEERLYNFITKKGSVSLSDYFLLEKIYEDYNYFYSNDMERNFLYAKMCISKTDGGLKPFYVNSIEYQYAENPILGLLIPEKAFIAQLNYFADLGIIDIERKNSLTYMRLTDEAYSLFNNYYDGLN